MLKKKSLIIYFIILQFFFCGLLFSTLNHITASSSTYDYYYLKSSAVDFSNATVISDGYDGTYWNDGKSYDAAIAVDSSDRVHVVWEDYTDGVWGTDAEIMYATYNIATGWSNVALISDGYNGSYWNDGGSYDPAIAIDSSDRVHVVWYDYTDGVWGTDAEIMYATYNNATGWSNAIVISDGNSGVYWNDGYSGTPAIAIDSSDKVHVVWEDNTDGVWGTDVEILYATYNIATGWSNVTLISDGLNDIYWNDGHSVKPEIAVDSSDKVHVVWDDYTDGVWSADVEINGPTDVEIMYATYNIASGWSNVTLISDGYNGSYWNDGISLGCAIAVDSSDKVYVVWDDTTDGVWGTDTEIMYAIYNNAKGWSNATVISDGYNGSYWNGGGSYSSAIAIDSSDKVHVVWADQTDGVWGIDTEIMYAIYNNATGWSNATVISDGYNGCYWNDCQSRDPTIAISTNEVHVVWEDNTDGVWGTDFEIMHIDFEIPVPPVVSGPGGIPFGNFYLLFIAISIIGLVAYKKRKI